ncbi:hypothetical protein C3387_07315 [Leclercia sp. LSNIH6]|nr:hypothetical protein C3370_09140 [Leclercia sp. LSNIH7]POU79274.1 hypothetical protein C3387_07315 [Leclercia sp. LSNIH6]POW54246.1 hypothetical protein C3406_03175 [Leclercia sp. LSNIH8]
MRLAPALRKRFGDFQPDLVIAVTLNSPLMTLSLQVFKITNPATSIKKPGFRPVFTITQQR